MSKITKKAINEIMDMYKNNTENVNLTLTSPNSDEVVLEVPIKNSMTISEKGAFIDRVVNACFDKDGDYLPQNLDPVFIITLLQMTTNLPVFEKSITLKNDDGSESDESITVIDIEKTYDFCKAIDLVKRVNDDEYQGLIFELKHMVDDKITYRKAVNARKASNSLTILKPIIESVEKVTAGMSVQEILDTLEDAVSKVASLENNVA